MKWLMGWNDRWDEVTYGMKWLVRSSDLWDEVHCEMKCPLRWSLLGMKCHSGRSTPGNVVAYWMKCHYGCSAFFPSGWSDMKKWSALGWSTGEPYAWKFNYKTNILFEKYYQMLAISIIKKPKARKLNYKTFELFECFIFEISRYWNVL